MPLRRHLQPGVAKHIAHGGVFRQHDRFESAKSIAYRDPGEALEELSAQTVVLKRIVHGEGHFGRRGVERDVRPGRDDLPLRANHPRHHQCKDLARVARLTQAFDERIRRIAQGEESQAMRLGREAVKQRRDGIAVFRPGRMDIGGRAVTQDYPTRFDRVLCGRRHE
jgi:hypothetical protein